MPCQSDPAHPIQTAPHPSAMQAVRELVNAAIAKGESALNSLPALKSMAISSGQQAVRINSDASGSSMSTASVIPVEIRVQRFKQELAASHINIHGLKRLAFHGIPDKDNLRVTVWKVLLGYLPLSPDEWKQTLARRRTQYHVFCNELIVDPKRPMQEDGTLHTAPSEPELDPLAAAVTPASSSPAALASPSKQRSSPTTAISTHDPLSPPQDRQQHHRQDQTGPLQSPASPSRSSAAAEAAGPAPRSPAASTAEADPAATPSSAATPSGRLRPSSSQQVPGSACAALATSWSTEAEDVTALDHPLSLAAGSRWRTFFQDNETLEQITRDVMRTHPDMEFFTGESEEAELHRQEMRRALFMYAKLNPGLRYIQGMNELIAPLYYLFKHDRDHKEAEFAEADAFWCFLELISEFRDHFCAQLDNAQTGIRATLRRLMQLLQHCDYDLWHHIEVVNKVDPQYYSFRWVTLLLSQEFSIPDTLRIWDTILGDPHGRMDCLLRICTAMILHVKPKLMQGDFTVIMKTLQRFPPIDVQYLLQMAAELPTCEQVLGHPV